MRADTSVTSFLPVTLEAVPEGSQAQYLVVYRINKFIEMLDKVVLTFIVVLVMSQLVFQLVK